MALIAGTTGTTRPGLAGGRAPAGVAVFLPNCEQPQRWVVRSRRDLSGMVECLRHRQLHVLRAAPDNDNHHQEAEVCSCIHLKCLRTLPRCTKPRAEEMRNHANLAAVAPIIPVTRPSFFPGSPGYALYSSAQVPVDTEFRQFL